MDIWIHVVLRQLDRLSITVSVQTKLTLLLQDMLYNICYRIQCQIPGVLFHKSSFLQQQPLCKILSQKEIFSVVCGNCYHYDIVGSSLKNRVNIFVCYVKYLCVLIKKVAQIYRKVYHFFQCTHIYTRTHTQNICVCLSQRVFH